MPYGVACSAGDHNHAAHVVRVTALRNRQRTLPTDRDLDRRVMVEGKIRKPATSDEQPRPHIPDAHNPL